MIGTKATGPPTQYMNPIKNSAKGKSAIRNSEPDDMVLRAPGGGKVGMSVDELQKLYGGALKASPHKYTQGGQYLAMDAGDVAPTQLIFEADANGKVTAWRVGLSPQVAYVEGCS